ncbi:HET-domain-containing protein [Byssothecium circinans]|uniref:HET-domain-containing protein n=1 Tax=Byssothecium circinans TaxID=147558 RepID=A0A6A5U682_9PLEO|nr:HET-domain-containing protein [Byssothecium circinans]
MRLLLRSSTGEFSLTKEFVGDDNIPPYAILSHTWSEGEGEVTFKDLIEGTGKDKAGYKKIQFCGQQAECDGLQYFWVDTCCIDKSNQVVLQDAINSMFRWYQNARECYVYLLDVSTAKRKLSNESSKCTWEPAFRLSRWFTRGWTLQELLAPCSVRFFSCEGKHLGNKTTLMRQIHEITGIALLALQGTPLCEFSIEERFSWTRGRQTTYKEDKAYSLLGMFDICMPLLYGEGEGKAFQRLRKKITKLLNSVQQQQALNKEDQECIKHLRLTDPRHDKKRIEETKGGLLEDSYRWILENSDFQRWRDDEQSRLLWIKGDPGKGKTMLLCGIINELNNSIAETNLQSYFFCQATDTRINNGAAVLRGLLYLLVVQQPSLISHIRKKHDHAGKALFEDANAWIALSEIFTSILQDPNLGSTYLVVDALDECVVDLPRLLDFIAQQSSASPRVKWIVSSRNWPDIEERLAKAGQGVRLSLELNAESVSAAVGVFIQQKSYKEKEKNAVLAHLTSNANDTFLWVALVCQNLDGIPRWKVLAKLEAFPPGLDALYNRMMQHISSSDDADLCKRILAFIAIVYRPVTLDELTYLCEPLEDMADDLASVQQIISLCGSFLTIRSGTVYFVHQSAKDFLCTKADSVIFPSGMKEIHRTIFSRSLQIMLKTLRRDMYSLHALGYPADQVEPPDPDPLAASTDAPALNELVRDARRFIMSHKLAIEKSPLQTYASALLFSPTKSLLRGLFKREEPEWIIIKPAMGDKWSPCLSTLEGHSDSVSSVAFSHDSAQLASASDDKTVKIWDAHSGDGECLSTLEGHSDWVRSVAFSHDSAQLASASYDKTVKIWDAHSGDVAALRVSVAMLSRVKGHHWHRCWDRKGMDMQS